MINLESIVPAVKKEALIRLWGGGRRGGRDGFSWYNLLYKCLVTYTNFMEFGDFT